MPANSSEGQPKPASADSGFMLSLPPLDNPFTSDVFLLRILVCMITHSAAISRAEC